MRWVCASIPTFAGRVKNERALQKFYILQHNSQKMALGRNLIHTVSLFLTHLMKSPMLNCLYSVSINRSNEEERIGMEFHLEKLKSFNVITDEIVVMNHCVTEKEKEKMFDLQEFLLIIHGK